MIKKPYIFAIIIATVLAIVVWAVIPKLYSTTVKLSDEYKEVDLAVGLNHFSARLRDVAGAANEGVNNIEVYCQELESKDFIRDIASTYIKNKRCTYGQWVMLGRGFWQTADTLELTSNNIEYNISSKSQTVIIKFTDRDPEVASLMLGAVTDNLQKYIAKSRQRMALARLDEAKNNIKRLKENYYKAQKEYVAYSNSHYETETVEEQTTSDMLSKEVDNVRMQLQVANTEYVRQRYLAQRSACSFAVVKSEATPVNDDSHLFAYIFSFVLIALSIVKGHKLYMQRKIENVAIEFGGLFSPWSVTLLVWASMLFLLETSGDLVYPATSQFYHSVLLWIPIMVITSFITYNLLPHQTKPVCHDGIEIRRSFFYLFFAIAVVLSPIYIYKVYQTVSLFDSKDMMNNVRLLAVYGEGFGFLVLSAVFSQVAFLVALWAYPKVKGWQLALTVICCIICSLAIMEKGTMFLVFICSIYVLYEKNIIKLRSIIVLGVIALGLMFMFNIFREGADSDYAKEETIFDFVAMYVISPPVAYCRVRPEVSSVFGVNTFSVIYDYLNRFGFGPFETHDKLQEFVYVPVSTNVYTVMQPFFRDFGYIGVAFFAWIYGLVTGVIYRFSKNGNTFCICFYTYIVELLILQFYQENIFLSLSFNIQLVILLALCTQNKVRLWIIGKGGER